ncbi:MAG: MFS transporter, partial [Deltaproteobacteria bacterium]|nr:MFS transporter [Deltaproteobacteria bacterium]
VQGPRVGLIIGLIWLSFSMGGTVGPWLGGWLFEINGNYQIAFMVAIAMFMVGCVAIWITAPRKFHRPLGS